MDRLRLSDSLEMSRIVYGMWRLGDDDDVSPSHIQAKVEACLMQGITTMDQADIYGGYTAKGLLGSAFTQAPGLRDRIELVSKCGIVAPTGRYFGAKVKHYNTSSDHIMRAVEQSLSDMRTDRLDVLLIHRPDPFMDHEDTGKALDRLVSDGKVLNVGVSNFALSDWTLLQSAMTTKLVTNQIELSALHHQPFLDGSVQWMQERGVPPMAWSPLGGGDLFGTRGAIVRAVLNRIAEEQRTDVAAVAVAWLLAHPARVLPVMGTNSLSRIQTLGDAMRVEIDRETWFEILTAAMGQDVP
ncbi:MAG: aldo/keto reductase [Devosiaceae bacterium]|nr:aldo/keto reductase [Devosiaceae bacterium MH13]